MLTLATPPELEERLQIEAQKRGKKTEDYALELLQSLLAPNEAAKNEAARLAAIAKLRGMGRGSAFGSEAIRRDRNEDLARDERDFQEHFENRS